MRSIQRNKSIYLFKRFQAKCMSLSKEDQAIGTCCDAYLFTYTDSCIHAPSFSRF